jgi:phage-related protein (TIGR01555 family)
MTDESKRRADEFGRRTDAIKNTLAGLGSTLDKDRFNQVGEPSVLGRGELDTLYRYNHYAARVINKPPDECTRRGWEIRVDGGEAGDPFSDVFARLDLKNKLNRADKWSRLYGGGAVVLGVDDGRRADEPVNWESISGVSFARVVDMWELNPRSFDNDWSSERFGEVATYNLSPLQIGGSGENVPSIIHAERVLRFIGVELPSQLAASQNYWGDSNLQRCWDSLARFGAAEADVGNLVHQFNVGVWLMQGLSDTLAGPGGSELFLERLIAASQSMSLLNSIALDAENEDYKRVGTSAKGVADLFDRLSRSFASAAEMPLTQLFGEAPGGLSTDDKSGRQTWYDQIAARQDRVYTPPIRHFVDLILASDERPEGVEADAEYEVEYLSLEEPTETEVVGNRNKQAQTDKIYAELGVLEPVEIREARFGGSTYSVETGIEDAAIERVDEATLGALVGALDGRIQALVVDAIESEKAAIGSAPSADMIAAFDERERRHCEAVRQGIDTLLESFDFEALEALELRSRARTHDASKMSRPEQRWFVWNTHRYRCAALGVQYDEPGEVSETVRNAVQFHKARNRHHPEYHESPADMTDVDLAELAADWSAVSAENGSSAIDWLDKTSDRFAFTDDQVDKLRRFIEAIEG